MRPVPVTLVSGFLGAGKSTFIRRILTEQHGLRIAVVENEFGQTLGIENSIVTQGIDSELIPEFVELPNGCLCCTVKDDLVDALSRLLDAKELDHIVIEASGAADPAPIAALFWVDDALEMRLMLDGIITVVDASAILVEGKVERVEFMKQITLADRVLLNKVDLISEHDRQRMESLVKQLNFLVDVQSCVSCEVPLRELLNLRTIDMNIDAVHRDIVRIAASQHGQMAHSKGLESYTVVIPRSSIFQVDELERALGSLLWEDDDPDAAGADLLGKKDVQEIWRIKGVVRVRDRSSVGIGDSAAGNPPSWWIVQGVDDTFEVCAPCGNRRLCQPAEWEAMGSRVLFIGKHLNRQRLINCLRECAHDEYTEPPSYTPG